MTDREIRRELRKFAERIFTMESSEIYAVKDEYERFCADHKVTATQLREFADSGAGEMLHMLTR